MSSEVVMFSEPLVGKVTRSIAPDRAGQVQCQSSCLPAEFYEPDCQVTLLRGEPVRVVGIHDRLLLVVLPA